MSNQDLPLLANINEVRARHYMINLEPNFQNKVIKGRVFIFFEATTACELRGGACTRACTCGSESEGQTEGRILYKYTPRPLPRTECHMSDDDDSDEEFEQSEPVNPEIEANKDFEIVLDCCDIRVRSVCEVDVDGVDLHEYLKPKQRRFCKFGSNYWSSRSRSPLQYSVNPWCIKIWKPGVQDAQTLCPTVVVIEYETAPQGKSILWRTDQDSNPCLFTPAAAINNRSLVPCQDPPFAMATWQAWVSVRKQIFVSMTGDQSPVKFVGYMDDQEFDAQMHIPSASEDCCPVSELPSDDYYNSTINEWEIERVTYYYHTTMVLPISTIAIAAGMWETQRLPSIYSGDNEIEEDDECHHYVYPCHLSSKDDTNSQTQLSVVHPISSTQAVKPLMAFLPYAVRAATKLMGRYPCHRLEVVVLPQCFGSLGLASPNLIFLSPTVVIDDPSAFIRLAHEISHAWFGIIIGAQDWTEEWLSEGFATYLEDQIFTNAAMAYHKAMKLQNSQPQGPRHKKRKKNDQKNDEEEEEKEENDKEEEKEEEEKEEEEEKAKGAMKAKGTTKGATKGGKRAKRATDEDEDYEEEEEEESEEEIEEGGKKNGAKKRRKESDSEEDWSERDSSSEESEEEEDPNPLPKPTLDLQLSTRTVLTRTQLCELCDIRGHIRYRTLVSELEHSAEELSSLRPMQGESLVSDGTHYVKNGLHSDKAFLQVHYLKGYFLLKYLGQLVGQEHFTRMIRQFAKKFHGQLVLSKHILDFFIKTFPEVKQYDINEPDLTSTWLNEPGINQEIADMYSEISNDLMSQVAHHLQFWEHFDKSKKRSGQTIKRAKVQLDPFIFPDQLVLLLEYLLELPKVYKRTLRQINEYYSMGTQCGDVRHRWCELVIKNDYEDLSQVERFLREDQAMGVYLYGELIISRNVKHTRLADQMFTKIQEDMDENARMSVFSMLYGE